MLFPHSYFNYGPIKQEKSDNKAKKIN